MTADNNATAEKIASLIDVIKEKGSLLNTKKITAGFDGFVDTIVKIIKNKHEVKEPDLFHTIEEFGSYILEKKGSSFSLEVEERSVKIGGNMPIIANALGSLDISVNCIGALGYPQTHKVFKDFSKHCRFYSFTDPGTSTAFEFNDGKILVAHMGSLNTIEWEGIKNIIGLDVLIGLYRESDLLCMVNWSEIDSSSNIWRGLLRDVFPHYSSAGAQQLSFFDLSDCSKRSNAAISEALQLLSEFAKYTKVTLGLNKNEARWIHQALFGKTGGEELGQLGERIFKKLSIETLLLHSSKEAMAINRHDSFISNSFFISNPKLSTGAGDNFNAGFNAAQLLGLELESCLIFANAVSGYYVKRGLSPQLRDIVYFLEENKTHKG